MHHQLFQSCINDDIQRMIHYNIISKRNKFNENIRQLFLWSKDETFVRRNQLNITWGMNMAKYWSAQLFNAYSTMQMHCEEYHCKSYYIGMNVRSVKFIFLIDYLTLICSLMIFSRIISLKNQSKHTYVQVYLSSKREHRQWSIIILKMNHSHQNLVCLFF